MRAIIEWHVAFEKGFSVMVSQRGAITGARRAAVALSLAHARATRATGPRGWNAVQECHDLGGGGITVLCLKTLPVQDVAQ